jgi:hypothetical protein
VANLQGGFGDLAGMLGRAGGLSQQLANQAMAQRHGLGQLFNDSPPIPRPNKDRTILEELQHETDVWLKDIDL